MYKADKLSLAKMLLEAAEQCINIQGNPIVQFMFLCNKAVSTYGNIIMKSFGFMGLKNYFDSVIDRFCNVYCNWATGFAYKQANQQSYPPQIDKGMIDVIQRISDTWKSLLDQMQDILKRSGWELVGEKQSLLERDIIRSYKTDTFNTLICVENPQVASFIAQNLKKVKLVDNPSHKTHLECKVFTPNHPGGTDYNSPCLSAQDFYEKSVTKIMKTLQLSYDLTMFYDLLKDIIFETLGEILRKLFCYKNTHPRRFGS